MISGTITLEIEEMVEVFNDYLNGKLYSAHPVIVTECAINEDDSTISFTFSPKPVRK